MSLEVSIRKKFRTFELDVDFSAGDEVLGFLGASGCGKSLTLRCIAGIERPDEGRIVVDGQVFFDSEQGIDLSPQERKTALLFQNYMLFPNLTVARNVAAGIARSVPAAERDAIVAAELARFGLADFGGRYPSQLSGGQQQRVALARMLAARPGILMLDEPFSALDTHLKGVLEQDLASLFDYFGKTVLYVSHDIDESLRFCDRIAVVEAGHIVEWGSGDDLVNHPRSLAGLRITGCKNTARAELAEAAGRVRVPEWGVELEVPAGFPEGANCVGIRSRFMERADGPGANCLRVRVERVTRSRFEKCATLSLPDAGDAGAGAQLLWTVDMQDAAMCDGLREGEELWIRMPVDRIYLVAAPEA